jgi:chemotaxis protein CheD
MDLIVGMGEYIVTDKEEDVLKTFALASCVAVTAYSPAKRAAGMIHVVLPNPLNERDRAERPCFFAQTGVPLMIDAVCRRSGCGRDELLIHMYGGADSAVNRDIYNVASENIIAVKKALFQMGLSICKSDLRGNESRTIFMYVKNGSIEVHRQLMHVNLACCSKE